MFTLTFGAVWLRASRYIQGHVLEELCCAWPVIRHSESQLSEELHSALCAVTQVVGSQLASFHFHVFPSVCTLFNFTHLHSSWFSLFFSPSLLCYLMMCFLEYITTSATAQLKYFMYLIILLMFLLD